MKKALRWIWLKLGVDMKIPSKWIWWIWAKALGGYEKEGVVDMAKSSTAVDMVDMEEIER